jgi:hypothetical protein
VVGGEDSTRKVTKNTKGRDGDVVRAGTEAVGIS